MKPLRYEVRRALHALPEPKLNGLPKTGIDLPLLEVERVIARSEPQIFDPLEGGKPGKPGDPLSVNLETISTIVILADAHQVDARQVE